MIIRIFSYTEVRIRDTYNVWKNIMCMGAFRGVYIHVHMRRGNEPSLAVLYFVQSLIHV